MLKILCDELIVGCFHGSAIQMDDALACLIMSTNFVRCGMSTKNWWMINQDQGIVVC